MTNKVTNNKIENFNSSQGIYLDSRKRNVREIKFRAWDKDKKKMVPVDMIYFKGFSDGKRKTGDIRRVGFMEVENASGYQLVFDFILMQYIGLKDKNGKEIYEGDIMREFNNHIPEVSEYSYYEVKFGEMGDARWGWYLDEYGAASGVEDFEKFEVIGNIYENPELLDV